MVSDEACLFGTAMPDFFGKTTSVPLFLVHIFMNEQVRQSQTPPSVPYVLAHFFSD